MNKRNTVVIIFMLCTIILQTVVTDRQLIVISELEATVHELNSENEELKTLLGQIKNENCRKGEETSYEKSTID